MIAKLVVAGLSMLCMTCLYPPEINNFMNPKEEIMNNTTLTIVARIVAKEESRELVKSELLKLIDITKAEQGCINYDLHQDNENPNLFLFYENWASKALWQVHMKGDHLAQYMKATEGAIEEFTLNEMTAIK